MNITIAYHQIAFDSSGKSLREAQQALDKAQNAISAVNTGNAKILCTDCDDEPSYRTGINSFSATKNLADTLFAPAKAAVAVLEAFSDVHPAVKVSLALPVLATNGGITDHDRCLQESSRFEL